MRVVTILEVPVVICPCLVPCAVAEDQLLPRSASQHRSEREGSSPLERGRAPDLSMYIDMETPARFLSRAGTQVRLINQLIEQRSSRGKVELSIVGQMRARK